MAREHLAKEGRKHCLHLGKSPRRLPQSTILLYMAVRSMVKTQGIAATSQHLSPQRFSSMSVSNRRLAFRVGSQLIEDFRIIVEMVCAGLGGHVDAAPTNFTDESGTVCDASVDDMQSGTCVLGDQDRPVDCLQLAER